MLSNTSLSGNILEKMSLPQVDYLITDFYIQLEETIRLFEYLKAILKIFFSNVKSLSIAYFSVVIYFIELIYRLQIYIRCSHQFPF